jgi:hypothetical protein
MAAVVQLPDLRPPLEAEIKLNPSARNPIQRNQTSHRVTSQIPLLALHTNGGQKNPFNSLVSRLLSIFHVSYLFGLRPWPSRK